MKPEPPVRLCGQHAAAGQKPNFDLVFNLIYGKMRQ
jgi:hypothetical protein